MKMITLVGTDYRTLTLLVPLGKNTWWQLNCPDRSATKQAGWVGRSGIALYLEIETPKIQGDCTRSLQHPSEKHLYILSFLPFSPHSSPLAILFMHLS
jgi:hypothetical protein